MPIHRSPSMHRRRPCPPSARRQGGQSTIEYAVGAIFVFLFLFAGSPSPVEMLVQAIRENHSATTDAIGSPTVGAPIKF